MTLKEIMILCGKEPWKFRIKDKDWDDADWFRPYFKDRCNNWHGLDEKDDHLDFNEEEDCTDDWVFVDEKPSTDLQTSFSQGALYKDVYGRVFCFSHELSEEQKLEYTKL